MVPHENGRNMNLGTARAAFSEMRSKTADPSHAGALAKADGRSERIRTSDPLLPKQVRYQAALHSVGPVMAALIAMAFGNCKQLPLPVSLAIASPRIGA
jgi:hypothetical protein